MMNFKKFIQLATAACTSVLFISACGESFVALESLKKDQSSLIGPDGGNNIHPPVSGPANYLYDLRFDEQEVGERCKLFSTTRMVVADFNGRRVCANTVQQGSDGFGSWGGILNLPKVGRGKELWIRVRTYYPETFILDNGGQMKFLRVRTKSAEGSDYYNNLYIDQLNAPTPYKFIFGGEARWINVGTRPHDTITFEKWETIEMQLRFDHLKESEGGQALVRVWKDGRMIFETKERRTLGSSDASAFAFYLYTYFGNSTSPATQTMYIDDVAVSINTPPNRDAHGNPYIGM